MFLVTDVNVVISSLLSKGDSFNVFALNNVFKKFDLIAPEFLFVELEKHKKEILERTKLSENEYKKVLDFVISQITFIPNSQFIDKIDEAKKVLGEHHKDTPYLALSLKLNCNIFSGDKIFKKICPKIVKSPKEILSEFYFE